MRTVMLDHAERQLVCSQGTIILFVRAQCSTGTLESSRQAARLATERVSYMLRVDNEMDAGNRMLTFSTDVVPEGQRFDYWRELVSRNLISVSIDRDGRGAFFGNLLISEIGSSRLLYVSSTSQHVARTGQRISQDRRNLYLLNYLVEGRGCTSQNGNFHDIAASDFFIQDS